jgi:hypothetical protein
MNCHFTPLHYSSGRETERERASSLPAFLGVTASQRKEAQSGCVPLSSIDDTLQVPSHSSTFPWPQVHSSTFNVPASLSVQVCLFSFHPQPTLTEQVHKKLCCTRNSVCQPLLLAVYHHIDHASTVSTKAHPMEGSHHHHKDPHCRKTSEHHSNHCKYGSNYHHHDNGSDHHHNISGPSQ